MKHDKIIALLPLKNEAWILKTYLSSISSVADEIIILDDGSTDDSISIALENEKVRVFSTKDYIEDWRNPDFSKRRACLLELGRKSEGTHFIWLDTDEVFSSNFIQRAKEMILALSPGQKLFLSWINLWKSTDRYVVGDSVWAHSFKDFVVCDSPSLSFSDKYLHEDRTPGPNDEVTRVPEDAGVVLHFNFANWEKTQVKQALYRCFELLKGTKSTRRINMNYSYTLDDNKIRTEVVPKKWMTNINISGIYTAPIEKDWRFIKLLESPILTEN